MTTTTTTNNSSAVTSATSKKVVKLNKPELLTKKLKKVVNGYTIDSKNLVCEGENQSNKLSCAMVQVGLSVDKKGVTTPVQFSNKQIASITGLSSSRVSLRCNALVKRGTLSKVSKGVFSINVIKK